MLSSDEEPSSKEEILITQQHEECPYCYTQLPAPLPEKVKTSLEKIAKHTSKVIAFYEKEAEIFCDLHKREYSILEGQKKGYPLTINFAELPQRIKNFKRELLIIIQNPSTSSYYKNALARHIASNKPISRINNFDLHQPGYYGPQGAETFITTLQQMFAKELEKKLSRLNNSYFISEVLVPEVAIRLIAEDRNGIPLKKAKKIMQNSWNFGYDIHYIKDNE